MMTDPSAALMPASRAVSQGVGVGLLRHSHDDPTIEWGGAPGVPAAPAPRRIALA